MDPFLVLLFLAYVPFYGYCMKYNAARSGWTTLAERYPDTQPQPWPPNLAGGMLVNTSTYSFVRLHPIAEGLRMRPGGLYSIGHPAICIPWEEIRRENVAGQLFGGQSVLTFHSVPEVVMKTNQKVLDKVWATHEGSARAATGIWEASADAPMLTLVNDSAALKSLLGFFVATFVLGVTSFTLVATAPGQPSLFHAPEILLWGALAAWFVATLTFSRALPVARRAVPKLWIESPSTGSAIAYFMYCSLCLLALTAWPRTLNILGDSAQPTHQSLQILAKDVVTNKDVHTYWLDTSSWRGHSREYLSVDPNMYHAAQPGQTVQVDVHPGLLGYPWYRRSELKL